MKNIIGINLLNGCKCESLANTNDGSNCVVLKITCDVELNPVLMISGENIKITNPEFIYEIPNSQLNGTDILTVTIKDNDNNGNISIKKTISSDGNLYLKYLNDFSYKLQNIKASSSNGNVDMSNYYNKNEVDELMNEKSDVDLTNYYTKTEVNDLVDLKKKEVQEEFRYFHFKYSVSADSCIIGNYNMLGEMLLPQGAYMLYITLSAIGTIHNPPKVKRAGLNLDYLIDERGVPHGAFYVSTPVGIVGTNEGTKFYETDGNDKVVVKVGLSTQDLENQMIDELANMMCEVEIYAVKVGNKFVQENQS